MTRSRTLALIAVVGACAALPANAAGPTIAVRALPTDREGVVVDYRARSGTAIVALRSGELLTVHTLRRIRHGTKIRFQGIKWGTPTAGIKWAAPARGVQWGIKMSRGGTYSSNMLRTGRSSGTRIRGVVVRRYRNGVAIGTRGGIVVVRMAVWLPAGGKITKAVGRPRVGDVITTNVRFGQRGRLLGDGARIVRRGDGTHVPFAGRVSRVSAANRTVRLSNVSDPAFGVHVTLAVPSTIDLARIRTNAEVAATATVAADGTARVERIAPNTSFATANDPANILIAPPPADAATRELLVRLAARWDRAGADGQVTSPDLRERNSARLARAEAAAVDGDRPAARAELQAFIDAVVPAIPALVAPQAGADVLALAGEALARLSG